MKRYRDLQLTALIGVLFFISASLYLGFSGKRDAFPLFSWALFTYVPNYETDFGLLITHLDGRELQPPRDFMELGVFSGAGNIRAYFSLQDLGGAILNKEPERIESLRRSFEEQYLQGYSGEVRYLIIARRFDPVDKWRTGKYKPKRVLALTRGEGL